MQRQQSPWGSLPEDIDLLKFLLERIKNVNPSCSKLRFLASEYKRMRGKYSSNIAFLVSRLAVLSGIIRKRDCNIDRETRAKMLFLLSVELSKKLLNRLRMNAHVEVDWKNRIIEYISNDGSLKLEGKHLFPVKTTEISIPKPPESTKRPAPEVPEANHPSSGNLNLEGDHKKKSSRPSKEERARIRRESVPPPESTKRSAPEVPPNPLPAEKRSRIYDIPRDIVLWYPENYYFPLVNHPPPEASELFRPDPECENWNLPPSPEIHRSRLEMARQEASEAPESRKRSAPEVPNHTKRARGSSPDDPAKIPESRSKELRQPKIEAPEVPEPSAPALKPPGSTKRSAPEMPNPSKKAKTDPDDSAGIPPKEPDAPEIQKLRQLVRRVNKMNQEDSVRQPKIEAPGAPNSRIEGAPGAPEPPGSQIPAPESLELSRRFQESRSRDPPNPRIHQLRQPKIEAPETPESPQMNPRIEQFRQPKLEEALEDPAPEAPNFRIRGALGAPEPPGLPAPAPDAPEAPESSGAQNDDSTPQIQFLSLIQSLVSTLNMPNLSLLHTRITRKIRESSSDSWIPNDEISLALELLVAKLTNHSVPIFPGSVESIGVKKFLCYLKATISNSKLEGLEGLMEKIIARIREPALKEKSIPMVRVAGLLQTALNNAGV